MTKVSFIFLLWGILTRYSTASKDRQTCNSNQWRCEDGSCIFLIGRCDNFPDCPDDSDERGCFSVLCKEGQRPCSSGECIDPKKFCDGVIHCKDAGDELAADCNGVILASTHKPTQTETTGVANKYTAPETSTTKKDIFSTQTSPPSTAIGSKWVKSETTTYPASVIVVPIEIHTKPNEWTTWPTKPQTTLKRTSRDTTTTTKSLNSLKTTKPYRHGWYISTYQPTTSKTPCIMVEDRFDFCRRRYRGYYRHPSNCKQYIVCEWAYMHICTCPDYTHWDLRVLTCVWDYTSPCVTGNDKKPVAPETRRPKPTTTPVTTSRMTSPMTTEMTVLQTSTPDVATTDFIPPPIRLRALPATPAWLKEWADRKFLKPVEPPPPQYQSLLTRFFKAMPNAGNIKNIRINK